MANCTSFGVLNTPINDGCSTQTAGFEQVAVIIPRSIIQMSSITKDTDNALIIKTLTLSGGTGQKVIVKGDIPYKDTKIEGKMGAYVQMFDASVILPITENTPASAKQVMQLANDKYVMVLQALNYDPAKKNKYFILGLTGGLSFQTGNFATDTQDNFGWKVELKEKESAIPAHFFWGTDEAASDAWFTALHP